MLHTFQLLFIASLYPPAPPNKVSPVSLVHESPRLLVGVGSANTFLASIRICICYFTGPFPSPLQIHVSFSSQLCLFRFSFESFIKITTFVQFNIIIRHYFAIMKAFVSTLINLSLVTLAAAQNSSSSGTSCVSSYQSCLDDGGADNTCQSDNAKCKNVCADSYGSCLESSDTSSCMNSYNSCLDSYTIFTTAANSAGKDCASIFSSCHDAGNPDNTCNSIAAQCKVPQILLGSYGLHY